MDGTRLRGQTTVITVTGANQPLASPSDRRRYIAFVPHGSNVGFVAINDRVLLNSSDGFDSLYMHAGTPMRWEEFGTLVCSPWFGFGSNAGDKITIIEGLEI